MGCGEGEDRLGERGRVEREGEVALSREAVESGVGQESGDLVELSEARRVGLLSVQVQRRDVWRVVRDELTVPVLERPAFAGAQPDTLAKSRPHRLQRSQDLRLLIDDAEGGEQDGEGPVGVTGVEGGLGVSSDAW